MEGRGQDQKDGKDDTATQNQKAPGRFGLALKLAAVLDAVTLRQRYVPRHRRFDVTHNR